MSKSFVNSEVFEAVQQRIKIARMAKVEDMMEMEVLKEMKEAAAAAAAMVAAVAQMKEMKEMKEAVAAAAAAAKRKKMKEAGGGVGCGGGGGEKDGVWQILFVINLTLVRTILSTIISLKPSKKQRRTTTLRGSSPAIWRERINRQKMFPPLQIQNQTFN